jgi:tRNA-modifying protein YgfZ
MRTTLEIIGLEQLGIVRVRGADAAAFLQGQLSNDLTRLTAQHSLVAGYHNPQGRTIAVLRLVLWDAHDILAIVPRELAPTVASRLAKFILRAKVKIVEESAAWRIVGLLGLESSAGLAAGAEVTTAAESATLAHGRQSTLRQPTTAGGVLDLPVSLGRQVHPNDNAAFVCVGDRPPRWLVLYPVESSSPVVGYPTTDLATWQQLEVIAGQPQVFAATSEEFVAQMLNLDALNAIAFDKGCYTGQEVIARAHYRGRVKRRMQRFISREVCTLWPGDSGQLADGRTFKVVVSAQLADGRCDFLAVAPMVGGTASDASDGTTVRPASGESGAAAVGSAATSEAATESAAALAAPTVAVLVAEQVPMAYPLPD